MSVNKPELRSRSLNFENKLEVLSPESPVETSPIPRTYTDILRPISYINRIPTYSIRFTQSHNYIKTLISHTNSQDNFDKYEITDQAIEFCIKNAIAEEDLIEAVQRWELATKIKEPVKLESAKALVRNLISDEKISLIYKYWVQTRKELKHPLVRNYWKNELNKDLYLSRVFRNNRIDKRTLRDRYKDNHKIQSSEKVIRQLEDCFDLVKLVLHRENIKKKILTYDIAEFEIKRTKHNTAVFKAFQEVISKFKSVDFSSMRDKDLSALPYLSSSKHTYKSSIAPTCSTLSISAFQKPKLPPIQVRKTPNNNLIFFEETLPKLPIRETYKLVKAFHTTTLINN